MFKALIPLAALIFATPLAAQAGGDPALDPACPQADLATPRKPGSVCIGRLNEIYAFSFVYPREAAQIPALDARLRDEALRAEVRFEGVVEQVHAQSQGEEPPPLMYYEAGWQVDANLPELLALSGTSGTYTGGAHGSIQYHAILFDRRRNRPIAVSDIFTIGAFEHNLLGQRPVGEGAVQRAFCRALRDAVRERRNGATIDLDCPEALSVPITLLCSDRGRIESMRALIAPYVVGPYAEGPYEIDFPVDALMMAAIRRRFRPAFSIPLENRPRRLAEPCR